ncbi:MAG: hypothetical protein ACPGGG_02120 [Parvibaculales bacterium]
MSETLTHESEIGSVDSRLSGLSDEARALFAELNNDAPETETETKADTAPVEPVGALSPPMGDDARADLPSDLPSDWPAEPINDPRAGQFISLLEHLDDEATAPRDAAIDEAMAVKAAQQWRKARADGPVDARPESYQATSGALSDDDLPNDITDEMADEMADADAEHAAELHLADSALGGWTANSNNDDDDGFDLLDDDFDDFDEDENAQTGKKGGLFSRFKGKAKGVRSLIGFKDASAAYNAQSGRSLLPFTIIRSVILLLVAAVPPLVNLAVIQPQISDNNRKLTELRKFEAEAQESQKIASRIANQVIREQKTAKTLFATLSGTDDFEPLVAAYIDALQRYDIDLRSYNVAVDEKRRVAFGDMQAEANIVELELRGRYDVYHEIRRVFIEESGLVTVLQEKLEAVPGEVELKITSKLLVPSRGQGQDEQG